MKHLYLAGLLFWFVCFPGYTKVEIEYLGNIIAYEDNPRLSNVISRLILSRDFYWHNASLFDLGNSNAQRLKNEVLRDLEFLISKTGSKTIKYATLTQLKTQISQWQVATKLSVELDYDLIRVKDSLDKRLDDGRYYLHLPFREYQISLLGAVNESKKLPHLATKSVEAYLEEDNLGLLEYVDTTAVFVIHPNGNAKRVLLGLHSQEHVEVPPGGFIYVPLRELPFDNTNAELNKKIARLAGNLLP